jgi:mevalonate kinase
MSVIASATAKIILFSEHFVIFGEPAIVMAINQRAYLKATLCKDKRIHVAALDLGLTGIFEKGKCKAKQGRRKHFLC